jgi:hypothetical protein
MAFGSLHNRPLDGRAWRDPKGTQTRYEVDTLQAMMVMISATSWEVMRISSPSRSPALMLASSETSQSTTFSWASVVSNLFVGDGQGSPWSQI